MMSENYTGNSAGFSLPVNSAAPPQPCYLSLPPSTGQHDGPLSLLSTLQHVAIARYELLCLRATQCLAFSCALVPGVQRFPALTEIPVLYREREKRGGGGARAAGKLEETRRDTC